MAHRVVSIRLDSNNPRHIPIIDWINDLPDSGRGKVQFFHIESALIEYVKKQTRKQGKTRKHKKAVSHPSPAVDVAQNASHPVNDAGKQKKDKSRTEPTSTLSVSQDLQNADTKVVNQVKKSGSSDRYKSLLNDIDFG